jgi:hypothetical protein
VAIWRTQTNDGKAVRFAYAVIALVPVVSWLALRHWSRAQRAYRPLAIGGALAVALLAVWLFMRDPTGLTTTFGLCIFAAPAFVYCPVVARVRRPIARVEHYGG